CAPSVRPAESSPPPAARRRSRDPPPLATRHPARLASHRPARPGDGRYLVSYRGEGGISRRLEADRGGGSRRYRVRRLFGGPVGIAADDFSLGGLVVETGGETVRQRRV